MLPAAGLKNDSTDGCIGPGDAIETVTTTLHDPVLAAILARLSEAMMIFTVKLPDSRSREPTRMNRSAAWLLLR